jgi:hypothetical protein
MTNAFTHNFRKCSIYNLRPYFRKTRKMYELPGKVCLYIFLLPPNMVCKKCQKRSIKCLRVEYCGGGGRGGSKALPSVKYPNICNAGAQSPLPTPPHHIQYIVSLFQILATPPAPPPPPWTKKNLEKYPFIDY